ncbi:MAG: flavodoxin domain-containing protein [Chitinophagaceae bacterium]
MLSDEKKKRADELARSCSKEELIWLSGYLAGLLAETTTVAAAPALKTATPKITLAYGSETGNSKRLATNFAATAKQNGLAVKLVSLDQYKLADLPKEEYFIGVISTHGDGEPPAAARKFYDHLHSSELHLQNLKYGIMALGDTSYPLFCKAGEDVDLQLSSYGAQRIAPLQMCDTDYETEATRWFSEVVTSVSKSSTPIVAEPPPAAAAKKNGRHIYTGRVITNINLNDRGSLKQTHHIEIEAADVAYEPGDALGLVPQNSDALVETILTLTGYDREKLVLFRKEEVSVYTLLKKKASIVSLPERVVKKYASLVNQDIPDTKIGLSDLLKIYPLVQTEDFEKVVDFLEPIVPRLYSISSSPEAHDGEIHLTVARNTFRVNEETKYGLCSDFMCGFPLDEVFDFYIHSNGGFRLPEDEQDVILIGPGTGIAPFRSFLAQRDATGATGRSWLFFGDQQFATDFLYQTEIQNWHDTGVLTKVNTAFSRDQKDKIYVQHRIRNNAPEFFEWIEKGAQIYVCGTRDPMSTDVEQTIIEVVQEQGMMDITEAREYVQKLKDTERYVQDVY